MEIYEYCPHCEEEIKTIDKVIPCANCGNDLVPCCVCAYSSDPEGCDVSESYGCRQYPRLRVLDTDIGLIDHKIEEKQKEVVMLCDDDDFGEDVLKSELSELEWERSILIARKCRIEPDAEIR